jgi:spermidine synthase
MPLVLTLVFILSGAAGLIYESIWSRYLGLFVGHSAYAQVIVLVIYLGGMSAGSAIAARFSSRIRQPLLAYAGAEVLVGLLGLVFHDAFRAVSNFAYASIFPALAGGISVVLVKWLLAGVLILPQSLLLGTTFPLMSAGFLRTKTGGAGRVLSLLYFANSIGAAAGVLLAGFWLIGLAGLPGTLLAAALINLAVGLVVFIAVKLQQRSVEVTPDLPGEIPVQAMPLPDLHRLWRVLLVVAAGTALSSFIYEIAWIRMLALVLGSATHSFEVMLSAFILGLALGAFWVRNRTDAFTDPMRVLGITQWAMGALAIATLGAYLATFDWMATLLSGLNQNLDGYRFFTVAKYVLALTVMLPATFCAGITLPLITQMLLNAGGGEKAVGAVYSVNTLGSILGAGVASLVLMPLLGMKALLVLGGALDMALGVWLLARQPRAGLLAGGLTAAMLAYAAFFVPFDQAVLIGGVYRYGRVVDQGVRKIAFYRDGRTATVSVTQGASGEFSLATNGKPDASISPSWFLPDTTTAVKPLDGDQPTQVLLPLVTLAYVPKAQQAAVIGNGSGISSHLLLGSPDLQKLVTIDIEPEMIAASRLFYPVNRRVFDDPRSQFIYDDAKSYFAANNKKFDLILSEPSNPWVSGVSGLFTDEFYQRMRTYLTPNGVFGQWLHLYEIDDALVLSVIQALHRNFPSYEIVRTSDMDFLIVASNQPHLPRADWRVFEAPGIVQDLQHFTHLTPDALDRLHLVSRAALVPLMADTSGANSDFFPTLDLSTERSRYVKDMAKGFIELSDGRFDVAAALMNERILPSPETTASLPIARLRMQALGARLRDENGFADAWSGPDKDFQIAKARYDLWQSAVASERRPADWAFFLRLALDVDADWHGGTMGWQDNAPDRTQKYLTEQHAPTEALAAWRFVRGLTAYDWPMAAAQVEALVAERKRGHAWLNDDLLRDGAVVALLHTDHVPQARAAFEQLAKYTKRKPQDFRVLLLEAHLVAHEQAGATR